MSRRRDHYAIGYENHLPCQMNSNSYAGCEFELRRITRLIMEAVEVGFFCANSFTQEYSIGKILETINSVLPTAYIVNTGYWVYYTSPTRTPLCVCRRFGLYCSHKSNATHWVNFDTPPEVRMTPLSANVMGKYIPLDFNVNVMPVASDILRSYDVSLRMLVEEYQKQNVAGALQIPNRYLVNADLRYLFAPEFYPYEGKPMAFSPHPLAHKFYGKYLATLSTYRDTVDSQYHAHFRNTLVMSMLPSLSIVPCGPTIENDRFTSCRYRNPFSLHLANEMNVWFDKNVKNGPAENARKRTKVPKKVVQAYHHAETQRRSYAPAALEDGAHCDPRSRPKREAPKMIEITNTAVHTDSKLFLETAISVNPSTSTSAPTSAYDDDARFFRDGALHAEEVERYLSQTAQADSDELVFAGYDYSFSDVVNNLLANSF